MDDTNAVLTYLTSKSISGVETSAGDSRLNPAEASTPPPVGPTEVLTSPILIGSQLSCLDFICDNTGTELLLDLALADFLLRFDGDANYRRLLGDSRWPNTVPVADAIPYFPAPFLALRTMKSDPVVGLKPGLAEMLDKEDSEWRVNGKQGMIQALL